MTVAAAKVSFVCNREERTVVSPPDRLLVDVLRDDLGLPGTKLGCGTGDCGACTVLLGGRPVTSCLVYVGECDGHDVETIEGVATTPAGAALADALVETDGIQCGICTPGIVVTAAALIAAAGPTIDAKAIKAALAGNLCRCTGYYPIVAAVQAAARVHETEEKQA
jgi:carbon-monoxide dehydrogenase small subunit